MLQNKKHSQDNRQSRVKPADRKMAELNTKHGKASNRRGIAYAARHAGGASEHFEPGGRLGIDHTSGSRKQIKGKDGAKGVSRKKKQGKEQRIVSG